MPGVSRHFCLPSCLKIFSVRSSCTGTGNIMIFCSKRGDPLTERKSLFEVTICKQELTNDVFSNLDYGKLYFQVIPRLYYKLKVQVFDSQLNSFTKKWMVLAYSLYEVHYTYFYSSALNNSPFISYNFQHSSGIELHVGYLKRCSLSY
jgi:hypothetical protein